MWGFFIKTKKNYKNLTDDAKNLSVIFKRKKIQSKTQSFHSEFCNTKLDVRVIILQNNEIVKLCVAKERI